MASVVKSCQKSSVKADLDTEVYAQSLVCSLCWTQLLVLELVADDEQYAECLRWSAALSVSFGTAHNNQLTAA